MQEDMSVISVTFAEYDITTLEFDGFEFGGNFFQVFRIQRIEWLMSFRSSKEIVVLIYKSATAMTEVSKLFNYSEYELLM